MTENNKERGKKGKMKMKMYRFNYDKKKANLSFSGRNNKPGRNIIKK
jgi:hypothetical protein